MNANGSRFRRGFNTARGEDRNGLKEFSQVLANYLATSPSPFITNVLGLGQSNVSFALAGATAGNYIVQSSTNLLNWQNPGPAVPRYFFTDTHTPLAPQTYYRLAAPTAQLGRKRKKMRLGLVWWRGVIFMMY